MAARFRVLDNGTLRDVKNLFVMQAGVLRRIRTLKVMDGDELRTVAIFAPPLTATATPSTVSGTGGGSSLISTGNTTAVPTGGQGPYTYQWVRVSGTGNINQPTSAQTSFWASVPPGEASGGVFRCTVTDSYGQTATTNNVSAVFNNFGGGPIS